MKTVRLGNTDLMVSEVGFGGIPIIPLAFDEAVAVVGHGYEQGINFFDTANMYGDSEKKIGRALESVRDQVILDTKTLERDVEKAAKHIAYSLDNLRTNRIDLYQFHSISKKEDLDRILAPGGAYEAVDRAKKKGEIRYAGFSSHDKATAIKACQTGLFSTVQFPFNLIEHDPADELFGVAEHFHLGIIAMKPLGGGLLDRAELCFRFLQQYPQVIPIPGFASKEELDEILDLYRSPRPLTKENQKDIETLRQELGRKFCHRCGYCMPCEQEIDIPTLMLFRPFVARKLPRSTIIHVFEAAMGCVEKCTECGECMERCPYHLPIPDLLRENVVLFQDYQNRQG